MSAFSGAPSRTLEISSPAIPVVLGWPALEPVRLSGREGVNSLFEYELLLKTPDTLNFALTAAADFDLDEFIGRELGCSIQLDGMGQFQMGQVGASVDGVGAGIRQINGLITDACLWGEEGRHVQCKLTLRPWLHLATLSTDCKIYQDKSVVQILDELLADYAFPVDKRLIDTYPARDYQTQYNESDFDFFSRLCQEWGISYHFEHRDGSHRLVLSDAMGAYRQNDSVAYQVVEYHAPGWKTDAEYLHSFVPSNHLTSGRYAARDYDYTRPRADLSTSRKDPRPTGQAEHEVYQWHSGLSDAAGSHYAQPRAGSGTPNDPAEEGRHLALLRMEALRAHGARAEATGNLRGMVPGCTFRLQKHPRQTANIEYLILDTRLLIEDVAQDSQTNDAASDRKQQWKIEVDLTVHPTTEPLRPVLAQPKPFTNGPHIALVVGPPGENLWTDDLGRIKVQFPWDRIGQRNQNSTCWLRVSSPWAGNQLGGMHVPRIGQEVVVSFIGCDPDLPICTGRLHNQMNLPPRELPQQGALSGFRSRELTRDSGNSAAGRSNHLVMDDTAGNIQAQLKSDHQSSSLSLGFITRIEDNRGRRDARGEGAELRTDGHGVLRAQDGLLITTETRQDAARHAKDMGETVARLVTAQAQHEGLGRAAKTAKAQIDDEDQVAVSKVLREQHEAVKGVGGAGSAVPRKSGNAKRFPELAEPHLVLSSAAGVAATTSGSVHLQAGEHIAITSQGHTSISAVKRLFVSAKDGIRLFALNSGIKLIAGNDKVQIEAHKDRINFTAKQVVRITSTEESIYITAPKKVVFNGGGSFTEWSSAGITHGTAGRWIEHAAVHVKRGPVSLGLMTQAFARVEFENKKKEFGKFPPSA